ncbi:hypothetical protein E2C01_069151 [Portunus trituberculatus]|uniref:Uncharacterized protein n=1 Tax=Portunus trituberculatus TaxID=210409 RepID=A0A5B7HZV1_PORTR|nr:hypothetical protein [Portunus trituberculatus]
MAAYLCFPGRGGAASRAAWCSVFWGIFIYML